MLFYPYQYKNFALGCEFHRISHKVVQHLPEAQGVPLKYHRYLRCYVHEELNPLFFRLDREEVAQVAENKRGEALATWWIGKADIANGDATSAREKLGIALRAFQAVEMNAELLACIEDHAGLLCAVGTTQECVRIYAAVAAARERLMLRRPPRSEQAWEDSITAARNTLGDEAFTSAWAEGRAWPLGTAIKRALAPASGQRVTA